MQYSVGRCFITNYFKRTWSSFVYAAALPSWTFATNILHIVVVCPNTTVVIMKATTRIVTIWMIIEVQGFDGNHLITIASNIHVSEVTKCFVLQHFGWGDLSWNKMY
jgi:hypothetical protein